jgi:hypothetical protein
LSAQRFHPALPVLPPPQHEVRHDGRRHGGGHGPGEAEGDRQSRHRGIPALHEEQQRTRHEHAGQRLGVRHDEHPGGRVEAPQRRSDEGEPVARRLGRGVQGQVEAAPHEQDADPAEDEVERDGGAQERDAERHQPADEEREGGVERPRAVGQPAGLGVRGQGDGVALLGDPLVPDAVPATEDVREGRVDVADARGGLEPRGSHLHGHEHEHPAGGVEEQQEDDGAPQRGLRHGAASRRGAQRGQAGAAHGG